jgi:hypothetical protein
VDIPLITQTLAMDDGNRVAVGIDVAEARKGLDLVAIDGDCVVVAVHPHLTVDAASHLVMDEIRPAVVCIDSPAQWSTTGNSREAERALSRLGINAFRTPAEDRAGPFHAWMRVGFELYDALAGVYPRYRGGDVRHTAAEYFPHASAAVLAGSIPALRDKPASRRQVLEDNGVSTTLLATVDQLDAALGALTGHIALAGGYSWVGDPDEGALLLPAALPTARLLRAEGGTRKRAGPAGAFLLPAPRRGKGEASSRVCGCGCGAAVRSEFLPGHDAKLRSRLLREARLDEAATAELRRRGWF